VLKPLQLSAWTCGIMFSCSVPAMAATLTVSGTSTHVVSGNETYTSITVGSKVNAVSTVNVNAGNTLTTGSASTTGTLLGHNATASGTLNVNGAGAKFTDNGNTYIGEVGTGAINISSGGSVSTGSVSTNTTYLGSQSGASGTVTVDGSGSTWTNTGTLSLGLSGNGTGAVQVRSGGSAVINGDVSVDKGNVTVTGAGSTFTGNNNGGHLYSGSKLVVSNGATVKFISSDPTIGSFYVTGGSALQISGTGTTMRVHDSANHTAWLDVISGSSASLTDGGYLSTDGAYIGGSDSTQAQMTVSGANTHWDSMVRIYVGGSTGGSSTGNGKLTVSGGAKVTSATGGVALDTGSSGTMILTGQGTTFSAAANSTLGTLGNFYVSYGGTGTVLVTDGALLHADHHISVATVSGSSGTLSIGAAQGSVAAAPGMVTTPSIDFGSGNGKLVFNHTSTDYVFAPNITGAGSVGLYSGTTRFTGSLSSYTGTMAVDGGTLNVADGQALNLGGNYQQSTAGALKVGASSGELSVAGTATFAAGSGIKVDVAGANTLAAGEKFSSVVSAGTLNASTFNLSDNSALFDFTATINGNAIDLNVHKVGSVVGSVDSTGLSSGVGAARVLDGFVASGTSGNDVANVVTGLGRLPTQRQVSNAVAQTLPLLVTGTSEVAIGALHATSQMIQARQAGFVGGASGDSFPVSKGFWVRPVGSWAQQGNRNGVSGYSADSYGLVSGIDSVVGGNTRLGLALSYMNIKVDGRSTASGNHAKIDAYQAIFYGSHTLDSMPSVEVNWQADLGVNRNRGRRDISFMNRTARSRYDSYTGHVGLGIARAVRLSNVTTIIPSLRADYSYIRDHGYTETGAGALNLRVGSNDSQELIVMAKASVSQALSDRTSLVVSAGLGGDLLSHRNSLTASYTGGGAAFVTKGMKRSPWVAQAGMGVAFKASERTQITARYDVETRSDFLGQTASVKFRWMF
jgi:T5SS/PEP-CTERM-associated repeat protein